MVDKALTVRDLFAERFGEDNAERVERAAEKHSEPHANRGSDPFKWAVVTCIGHQCFDVYMDSHEFTMDGEEVRQWVIENINLGTYDGDYDVLALFAGAYQEWVPDKPDAKVVTGEVAEG